MMWDRIFAFFSRRKDGESECCDPDRPQNPEVAAQNAQRRHDLDRREREARRMNDALEDLVKDMRQD